MERLSASDIGLKVLGILRLVAAALKGQIKGAAAMHEYGTMEETQTGTTGGDASCRLTLPITRAPIRGQELAS
jgi:hypothetical protein